jgi:predicted Zn-dependent peptidase
MLGLKAPPLNHPNWAASTILNTLLGWGMSSRFYTTLRGDAGLCYSVETDVDEFRHTCILITYLAMHPSHVEEVLQRVCAVYHAVSRGDISSEELERSRGQAIGQLLMAADRPLFHARTLALSTFLTGTTVSVEAQIAQLARVTLGDLRRAAEEIICPERVRASFVGPLDEGRWKTYQEILTTWNPA